MNSRLVRPVKQDAAETRCAAHDASCAFLLPTVVLGYPERLDPARLQSALATVLDDFGPFAGKLTRTREHWYFAHGAGAVFETDQSEDCVRTLGAALRTGPSSKLCPSFAPVALLRRKAPLLGARLTQTPDGSVLGVIWNHAVGDYHSMMLLLRAWVLAYRGQPYKRPLVVADRQAYLDEKIPNVPGAERYWRVLSWSELLRTMRSQIRWDARRVALDYSWSQIMDLHAEASSRRSVSPADALCAHLISTLRTLSPDVSPYLSVAINYRKRFQIPVNLLGNVSDFVHTSVRPGDDMAAIAATLRSDIEAFGADSLSPRALLTLTARYPGPINTLRFMRHGEPGRINLCLTDVSRVGHYKLAFASACPTFVHTRATDAPIVGLGTVFESPGSTGLTVDVVLPSDLAQAVIRHNNVLSGAAAAKVVTAGDEITLNVDDHASA